MMDEITVVKIGGNIIDNPELLNRFLSDFAALKGPKILIHGGGKLATNLSKQLNIPVELIEGRRITSSKNLDVVTMVYAGLINKKIVAKLASKQCPSLGLSGADGNSILATKRPNKPIDYGWVGDVEAINSTFIDQLLQNNISPVFCAISHDGKGQLLNTNADTVAAEIAIALNQLGKTRLIYCFEKKGVLQDIEDENSVIPTLDEAKYQQLKANGNIHKGMIPKLDNCFYALKNQVSQVKIGYATVLQSEGEIGTTIKL